MGRANKRGTTRKRRRDKHKHSLFRTKSRPLPHNRKSFLSVLSSLWTLFFVVLSTLAAAATLYALSPSISVSNLPPMNESDPFTTPFTINNSGWLTAYDVHAECYVKDVKAEHDESFSNFHTVDTNTADVGELAAKETASLPCAFNRMFKTAPVVSADIAITVSYRPAFYPYRVQKPFRFVTAQDSHGNLRWLPQPVGSAYILLNNREAAP